MLCQPVNNFEEHFNRFLATKKNRYVALNIQNRQYSFKKINSTNSNSAGDAVQSSLKQKDVIPVGDVGKVSAVRTSDPPPMKSQQTLTKLFSRTVNSQAKTVSCLPNKENLSTPFNSTSEDFDDFQFPYSPGSFTQPKVIQHVPLVSHPTPKPVYCSVNSNQDTEVGIPVKIHSKSNCTNNAKLRNCSVLNENIEEYSSASSLDNLNRSIMSQICSALEENTEILDNNELLKSLLKFRQKVLSRYEAAQRASPDIHAPASCRNSTEKLEKPSEPFFRDQSDSFNKSSSPIEQNNQIHSSYNLNSQTYHSSDLSEDKVKSSISFSESSANSLIAKSPVKFSGEAGNFYGNHHDDGMSEKFKGYKFPHSSKMLTIFKNTFGLQKFRYNQLEAINAALVKEDCFVLMPTGGGKSLCYQLPAMLSEGVTLVVSPLRSLIMDQVQKLWSLDVPADSLSGEANLSAVNNIYKQLACHPPGLKMLYVTPEKISASNKLISALESLYARKMLARFVIDEAHCVSEWGHDFRPDYKRLKVLKEKFPGVPMIALTATATPRVRLDILKQLNMGSPKWFLQSFNRPNLKYEVRSKKGKSVVQDIAELIKSKFRHMSGIVYCLSRNDCDSIAKYLCESNISAVSYHAGLDNRSHVQEAWFNDKSKVVCATIAFGMGIDKPDVRFVIHHSIPKSMECYYQESGRAGRDGELSWCILYYSYQDVSRIKRMIQSDEMNRKTWSTHFNNLYKMVHYCENKTDCRRVQLLEYLGERFDKKHCSKDPKAICDNCISGDVYQNCDVTNDATAIVSCLSDLTKNSRHRNYTLTYLVDIFKGAKTQKIMSAGHDKLPLHGRGSKYVRSDAERLLRKLVLDHFLQENLVINHMDMTNSYVYLGPKADELLSGRVKIIFAFKKGSKQISSKNVAEVEDKELDQLTEACYNELIEVSKALAADRKMHYANIINVEALRQMSRELPMTEQEMLDIPHVTRAIYDKYGKNFLDVTQRYGAERSVILAEREDNDMLNAFIEDDEGTDMWAEVPSCSRSKFSKPSYKRKKYAKGPPAKRKGNFSFWKKNTKNKTSNYKKNRSYTSGSKTRSESSTSKSRGPGFLPVPKPQYKTM